MLCLYEWTPIDSNGSGLTSTESFLFNLVGLHKMLVFILIAFTLQCFLLNRQISQMRVWQSFRNAFGVNSHLVRPPP